MWLKISLLTPDSPASSSQGLGLWVCGTMHSCPTPVYWDKVCYFCYARQLQKQEADLEEGRHHMRFGIGVSFHWATAESYRDGYDVGGRQVDCW